MTEAELRAKYDREVSLADERLRELVWKILKETNYVDDVCAGPSGWAEFKEEADRWADQVRQSLGNVKPPGRASNLRYTNVSLTDLEAEHAAALASYLTRQAACLPEVRTFRDEKLRGSTLEPEQVVAFLRRELTHLRLKEYADLRGDLGGDAPNLALGKEDDLKDLLGGWANRSGESQVEYESAVFLEALEADSTGIPMRPEQPYMNGLMHLIRDEAGKTLENFGSQLVSRYPWTLRDAVWFVLTGEPPKLTPLKIQGNDLAGTHTLTFLTWISEKTIRRAYHSLHVGDNRPLGHKSLSAFRFVDEHTKPGQTPKWAELTRRWNKDHPNPKDKFTDRSALQRAYKRAEERLASPWVI